MQRTRPKHNSSSLIDCCWRTASMLVSRLFPHLGLVDLRPIGKTAFHQHGTDSIIIAEIDDRTDRRGTLAKGPKELFQQARCSSRAALSR